MSPIGQQRTVLLAEPDAVLGLELSDALTAAGYRVVGPLAKQADAAVLLGREVPDLVILDLELRDGPCSGLARTLRQRGVPILIHSDHRPDGPDATALSDAPWLAKPAWPLDVVALLGDMTERQAA